MPTYVSQIEKELRANGWEVASIEGEGSDWWWTQRWVVRSNQDAWGAELVVTFLVDPMWESGPRSVAYVAATEFPPKERVAAMNGVALLDMCRGDFRERLHTFVAELTSWRSRQAASGC